MPSRFQPGDRVTTPDFGEGIVRRVAGNEAIVAMEEFDDVEIRYELRDLEALAGETVAAETEGPTEPSATAAVRPAAGDPSVTMNRRAIEALRFGLVPGVGIEQLTIGFTALAKWIESRLPHQNEERPTLSEVCGPFGTGKSHTMSVVRHVAQKLGYVTAHVEVDGRLVSFSDPARLLAALWCSTCIDGQSSITPLLDLYIKAIERTNTSTIHPSLDRIREYEVTVRKLLRAGCVDKHAAGLDGLFSSNPSVYLPVLTYEIEREPNIVRSEIRLRRMIGHRLADRPRDFVQSLAGNAIVAQLAGYRGLVVTIDEFEVEHLDQRRFERAGAALIALTEYLNGGLDLPAAPLALFVGSVGQEGHIGDEVLDVMMRRLGSTPYELAPIDAGDQHDLAERIHSLYCDAYSVEAPQPEKLLGRVEGLASAAVESESGFIRAFIKSFVSACDVNYGPCGYR